MRIFTDSVEFANNFFPQAQYWQSIEEISLNEQINEMIHKLIFASHIYYADIEYDFYDYAFITSYAEKSQYTELLALTANKPADFNIIALAGEGINFTGFHNRSWTALWGNVHLTLHLTPRRKIVNYMSGFMMLGAVSAITAIDHFLDDKSSKAHLKWINDVYIDNTKVCGILSHSRSQGDLISDVVLGIGLNVSANPNLEMTFNSATSGCLNMYLPELKHTDEYEVFIFLIRRINYYYNELIKGNFDELYNEYLSRSMLINKTVEIEIEKPKSEILIGYIESIGKNLELYLKEHPKPLYSGKVLRIFS